MKFIKHFHKAAHVRALEVARQIHVHIDGGVDRLGAAGAVQHDNRVFNIFYADFFNIDIAKIFLILNVNHIIKYLDRALKNCVIITFLSFRASEARHGIQYF